MADINKLISAFQAQKELERQGSVMARPEKPQWRKDSPLMDTVFEAIDMLASGISPLDALSGGVGNLAHVPQTYRNLGLQRQGGALNPIDFAAKLMEQGNFPRFKQLVEFMTKKGLGEKFEGFRGYGLNDPMAGVAAGKGLPPATAITTKPQVAEGFARDAAYGGVPSVSTKMDLTPESVLALLPRRKTPFGSESELLVDPRWAENLKTMFKINPGAMREAGSYYQPEFIAQPHSILDAAMADALAGLRQTRPIPGSGAAAKASTEPPAGIVEALKKALKQSSQPPMENLY